MIDNQENLPSQEEAEAQELTEKAIDNLEKLTNSRSSGSEIVKALDQPRD